LMFFGSAIPEPAAALLLGSAVIVAWGPVLLLRPGPWRSAAKLVCIAYEAGMDFMTMYPLQKQPNVCPQFILEKKAA